jgi:hypothetical protein
VFIITEDSGSGKIFLNLLIDYIKECNKRNGVNRDTRYFVLDTGEICKKETASNILFTKSVERLLRGIRIEDEMSIRISREDRIVVCYDNNRVDSGIIGGELDNSIDALKRSMRYISNTCGQLGITVRFSDYTCFEELILSYNKLIDLVQYDKNDKFNKRYKELAQNICKGLQMCHNADDKIELYNAFRKAVTKGKSGKLKTTESLLAILLKNITGKTNIHFRNWVIDKGSLGICWQEIDCNKNKCKQDLNKCKECYKYIRRHFSNEWYKLWDDLVNNSKIKDLYDKIV